jgi:hypothetical protein
MTVVVADAKLRWVCGACGGPRVPGASGKNAALTRARAAQAAAFGWSGGSIALALTGALTSGMAALLWTAALHGLGAAIGVLGAIFLLFAWRASARAGVRRREATEAVAEGWREGARSILAARGRDTTAADLAVAMQIEEAEAEELLNALAAQDEVRLDVGDGGELRYRVGARARAPETKLTEDEERELADALAEHQPGKDQRRSK